MSVVEAHRLASQIEHELKLKFPEVSDVVIHVEPGRRRTRTPKRTPTRTGLLPHRIA